jgi:hypothetical protein
LLEERADFLQVDLRRRSERHAPVMPFEQPRTKPILEQTHVLAHRAVRHVQFGGGILEAAEPASGLEGTQCIKWRQYPFHSREFL